MFRLQNGVVTDADDKAYDAWVENTNTNTKYTCDAVDAMQELAFTNIRLADAEKVAPPCARDRHTGRGLGGRRLAGRD